jgi:hypothetical protein
MTSKNREYSARTLNEVKYKGQTVEEYKLSYFIFAYF